MPVKISFKIDQRLFMAKIKGVGTKVIPYVKADIKDLAIWAFGEIIKETPETTARRTKIKDLWVIHQSKKGTIEQFVIKNLYPNQDVLMYMEEGTLPHIITPSKPGGFLHFFIQGNEIFTRMVKHPGTPKYEMIAKTEAKLEKKVDWLIQRWFKHVDRLKAMGIT